MAVPEGLDLDAWIHEPSPDGDDEDEDEDDSDGEVFSLPRLTSLTGSCPVPPPAKVSVGNF